MKQFVFFDESKIFTWEIYESSSSPTSCGLNSRPFISKKKQNIFISKNILSIQNVSGSQVVKIK